MNEPGRMTEDFSTLTSDIRDYVNLRVDYVKLVITEKVSRLASFFLISVIFFILAMFLLLFISLAFVFWFGESVGPTFIGALIVVAFYVLIGVAVYLGRHKLFINPLVAQLTRILMEGENDEA